MKILVLGSRGNVGRQLVDELESRDVEVIGADMSHSDAPNYRRCDLSEFRQIQGLVSEVRPDYVYNLAAEFGRWNGEQFYEQVWKTNVIGTKHLLLLQQDLGYRLVHFSSSEVYGDYTDVMDETVMDNVEVRQLNDYAISKWVNELQINNSEQMHQTQSVRVRLFNTYGPGERYTPFRSAICTFAYKAIHDIPYTVFTDHTRTSTYISDACATLANISSNFHTGEVYNIGSNTKHDMKTASDLVLAAAGKTDSLIEYKDSEPHTTMHKQVDISKAVKELGHRDTVSLESGIKNTVDWMKEIYSV
jgi:dTDP-glucose 4,6-dehydratase